MTTSERPARPEDGPDLLPLLAELSAGDREAARAALDEAFGPGRQAWVQERDHEIVGFLSLAPSAVTVTVGFVDWLAVSPAHRRQGLGLRLLRLAQRCATDLGWRQLHAYTFGDNRASLHLYIEAGFLPITTLRDYIAPGRHYVHLMWEP